MPAARLGGRAAVRLVTSPRAGVFASKAPALPWRSSFARAARHRRKSGAISCTSHLSRPSLSSLLATQSDCFIRHRLHRI